MNCEDFEPLLADALGDELSDADRAAFDAHLAECGRCRREYETTRAAVESLRALPGPRRVMVRREGDRLVIRGVSPGGPRVPRWLTGAAFRYAASVLIAFAGGYALHAGLMIAEFGSSSGDRGRAPVVAPTPAPGDSFQEALLSVHERNPHFSDLAKCLIAMYRANG